MRAKVRVVLLRPDRRLLVPLLAVLALVSGLPPAAAQSAPAFAGPDTRTPGQSTYTPATPLRLLDTREEGGPVGEGGTRDLVVAGRGGVPATATAVVLSVTLLSGARQTDVKVYAPPTEPSASSLVAPARGRASNLVTSALDAQGQVRLRNAGGSSHLIVDLAGWWSEEPGSLYVAAQEPDRLLDTRDTRTPLQAQEVRTLRVAGVGSVPAGATAVVVNLTAVNASQTTDVRAYPTRPGAPPEVSNSNPGVGRPTAVAAVVAVGDGGSISLRNAAGSVDLVVDLQGWMVPEGSDRSGAAFHVLAPQRLLDTRETGRRLAEGAPQDVVVAGQSAVRIDRQVEVPPHATAVALTVTALGATAGSDVRVYPAPADDVALPPSSTLNVAPGALVANAALPSVGRDGEVRLRNGRGTVNVIVDLVGWFAPVGRGWDVSWPQCTSRGATTSRLPSGGAFAVVGMTRSRPFTDNECFAAQWAWASSLPGEPAVYINTNAPGSESPQWRTPGPRSCSGASSDAGCAFNYGRALASYVLERMPTTPDRGRPFVWFDVELGPTWQTGYSGAVTVNRNVVNGAAERLREAGHRYGLYVDRTSADPHNDWFQIMGRWQLPHLQSWVFRAQGADPRPQCAPSESPHGGPVVMVQSQPGTTGSDYDVNDLC